MSFVLNLIGGPGSGKSTTAAGLFFFMKLQGIKCELVTEYAKELTYDENWVDLERQLYVLSEQERRQRRLVGKVDFVITDSPLLTSIAYAKDQRDRRAVETSARSLFATYNNLNFVIERVKPYAAYGRKQSEADAKGLDRKLIDDIWSDQKIERIVPGDRSAPDVILDHLRSETLI